MVISQVVGVGIFLAPAAMMRTTGGLAGALGIWIAIGILSTAGALCYAELATRYPRAGGAYVFLREAYGSRVAFVYGWMSLLVMDPGITAALGLGFSQYLGAALRLSSALLTPVALAAIVGFALLTLGGLAVSSHVMRWTAVAKLTSVAVLVVAGLVQMASGTQPQVSPFEGSSGLSAIAGAVIAAFFAFGGWWDLGRMSEEVDQPLETMPRALVGGLALVTAIYTLVSISLVMAAPPGRPASDEVLVIDAGAALFGTAASRVLAWMIVIAVAGSLAAVLLAAPRVYVAMARDGLFPSRLGRFNSDRGTAPAATLVQTALACVLVLIGSFNGILGYFVPAAVFFLGLSAAALFVLRRPAANVTVFRAPLHPLPLIVFLLFTAAVLMLFVAGQPKQTLIGALVVACGVPVSYLFRHSS